MKSPKFEPHWALWIGCLIAPLACALNAALLEAFVSDSPLKTGHYLPMGIVMAFLTAPQGGVTYVFLKLWEEKKYRAARVLSAFCGLIAPLFWLVCWHGLELSAQWGRRSATPLFGALLVPVLWSGLFLIFPLLARPPRN